VTSQLYLHHRSTPQPQLVAFAAGFQGAFCNLRGCDRGLPLRAAVDGGSVRVRVSPRMAPAQQGLSRRG